MHQRGQIDRSVPEDENSDSGIEDSGSDDSETERNPYGFPLKPPSRLTGAQKAEYVKCLDRKSSPPLTPFFTLPIFSNLYFTGLAARFYVLGLPTILLLPDL